jgi:hypothetical protein
MGTIFAEERYAFDSLAGIREAYSDAFSVDHARSTRSLPTRRSM